MKIKNLETYYLEVPFPEDFNAANFKKPEKSLSMFMVKVFTNDGIVGIGGQRGYPAMAEGWTNYVDKIMKPYLINEIIDPAYIEKFSQYLTVQAPGICLNPRPCSIEMALWDILGKKANLPVYKLLGAKKSKVKAYASMLEPYPLLRIDEWISFVQRVYEVGFKAIKLHLGARWGNEEIGNIVEIIKNIKNEFGNNLEIMVDLMKAWDTDYPYDLYSAIKLAKTLEEYDVKFLEEPLPHINNPTISAKLCESVDIPIAGGGGMFGWQNYKILLEKGALDIVEPDVQICGGMLEVKKIAFLADSFGKSCIPHFWGPGIALAATLQVTGAIDAPYLEYNYHPPAWTPATRDAMLEEPINIDKDGYIKISDKPGLGFDLNEGNVKKYTLIKY